MKTDNKLPDKPSELILLALKDLEACENDQAYKINMDIWHYLDPLGQCIVCLAGSVMSQSLSCPPHDNIFPDDFNTDTEVKLNAINFMRRGAIWVALEELGYENYDVVNDWCIITPYEESPNQFKKDMCDLADYLSERGF